jgi:outer membrane protein W
MLEVEVEVVRQNPIADIGHNLKLERNNLIQVAISSTNFNTTLTSHTNQTKGKFYGK